MGGTSRNAAVGPAEPSWNQDIGLWAGDGSTCSDTKTSQHACPPTKRPNQLTRDAFY